ncbi:6660_t:CDS:1, partial [Funneliformis mosseae]
GTGDPSPRYFFEIVGFFHFLPFHIFPSLFLRAVIHNSYAIDEEFVVLLVVFHFGYEFINIREILLDLQV